MTLFIVAMTMLSVLRVEKLHESKDVPFNYMYLGGLWQHILDKRDAAQAEPANQQYTSIPQIHSCVSNQFFPPLVGLVLIYDTTSPMDT